MSHKGYDADSIVFCPDSGIFERQSEDYRVCRPVICASHRQSVHRRTKLFFFRRPPEFFNRKIVDRLSQDIGRASGNGLPTRGTSNTSKPAVESTDHRAMSFEISLRTLDDLKISGRFQSSKSSPTSKVITRRPADARPICTRFSAD